MDGRRLAPITLRPAGAPDSQAEVTETEEEDQFFEHREKLGMKLKLAIADRCLIPAAVKLLFRQFCAIAHRAPGHSCPFGRSRNWRERTETQTKATRWPSAKMAASFGADDPPFLILLETKCKVSSIWPHNKSVH